MQVMQNLSPDSFTLVRVISALAELSMPRQAKWIHRLDEKHVSTWNAMIDGYGTHSLWEEAVELFEEMRKGHPKPNEVTFLCVVSACSHSGYVDKGRYYFSIMKEA
ncbi:hypothetical protein LIER_37742 [Lithospermum erythrorhizon]|uniref:Pentatricopeptide repeat-containing protein n=1 Tax=Lithospermum erythrorhizon TaxID=34254 RepID=A0AAV3PRV9_LITER